MLRSVDEIELNQVVHLFPHTKVASRACHALTVARVIKDPKAHWPMVVVGWKEATGDRWELVHKDNIRLKPRATQTSKVEKKEGDTVQGGGTASIWARVRKMPGKVVEVNLAETEEQGTLF
jgi:hypothetical protein